MKPFDNARFLRLRWEVYSATIGWHQRWRSYAKGGEYAPYYADLDLVLNWDANGHELEAVNWQYNGSTAQVRQASSYWGRPGVTYSRRSAAGFSARILPADFVCSDSGPACAFRIRS